MGRQGTHEIDSLNFQSQKTPGLDDFSLSSGLNHRPFVDPKVRRSNDIGLHLRSHPGLTPLAPIESLLDEDNPVVRFAKVLLALMLLFQSSSDH